MREIIRRFNLFTVLIAILTFIVGWQMGHSDVSVKWAKFSPTVSVENKEPPSNITIDFKLFWDTWNLLSQNYLDKKALDQNKMFYGAIQGMVAAIGDPYTVFLPPKQQKSSKEELGGSFEGVGIELGFNKDKRLVVVAPLDGTPAKKAGIDAGDLIIKINDKDATSMNLIDAVNVIRGPKGTNVKLTIYREGEQDPRDFDLTRDTIVVKSVQLSYREIEGKKFAVLKLSRFGERTKDEWNTAVSDILSQSVEGAVLDLRNNPGGYLDGAVFISSEFLNGGDVVLQENSQGEKTAYKVNRQGKLLNLPLVVLINKGSASASEIVAGALQDRKRAKIVGVQSFGKGTVQETQDLPGGTGIHITVAKWLTPSGRWVNDTNGFEPDITVEVPKPKEGETLDATEDVQMEKAIEALL